MVMDAAKAINNFLLCFVMFFFPCVVESICIFHLALQSFCANRTGHITSSGFRWLNWQFGPVFPLGYEVMANFEIIACILPCYFFLNDLH